MEQSEHPSDTEPLPSDAGTMKCTGHLHPPVHHSSLWRHLLKVTPLILVVSSIIFYLTHAGWLRILEMGSLDTLMRSREPMVARYVSLVKITDDDYQKHFEGRSPLNAGKLKELINAIALGKPALIAVDIDTSHPDFKNLQPEPWWPPIVWAQSAAYQEQASSEQERIKASPVLGGQALPVRKGLAIFPDDSDGALRHYRRAYETIDGTTPTFAAAIVAAWKEASANPSCAEGGSPGTEVAAHGEDHDLVLDLTTTRFDFNPHNASDVLIVAKGQGWQRDGPLKDQIVVLGGEYDAARDFHKTPLGKKSGMELIAHAVEAELQGRIIVPAPEWMMIVMEVASGYLLAVLHFCLGGTSRWHRGLVWGAIPVLALASSAIAFSRFSLWANFMPVMVAVRLHAKLEQGWESLLQRLRSLLQKLRMIAVHLYAKLEQSWKWLLNKLRNLRCKLG